MPSLLLLFAPEQNALASGLALALAQSGLYARVEKAVLGGSPTPSAREAEVALLLLSPDFLKPEYEMAPLLDEVLSRATEENFLLTAVIAAECDWEESPYSGLPLLPEARVALDREAYWGGDSRAFAAVQQGLEALLADWRARRADPQGYWKARLQAGPSAARLALRLAWKMTPRRVKYGLAALLLALTGLLMWWGFS